MPRPKKAPPHPDVINTRRMDLRDALAALGLITERRLNTSVKEAQRRLGARYRGSYQQLMRDLGALELRDPKSNPKRRELKLRRAALMRELESRDLIDSGGWCRLGATQLHAELDTYFDSASALERDLKALGLRDRLTPRRIAHAEGLVSGLIGDAGASDEDAEVLRELAKRLFKRLHTLAQ